MGLGSFLQQIGSSCVEQMTCWPDNPLATFEFYNHVYGIPNAATLGLFLGMLVGALYVRTRSIVYAAVLGIYVIGITAATWVSDAYVEAQYRVILYVIAMAICSVVVIFVLKLWRE